MLDGIGQLGYLNAIILFCALVFVHELGHYLIARYNKVTVEVFSIGFGPELFGWVDKAGTRWRFSAIPLGGYVKMYGENASALEGDGGAENDDATTKPVNDQRISFATRSIGARAAIIAAGPIANFLFAIVLFAILFAAIGKPTLGQLDQHGISMVEAGSAADQAGLQAGDRITAINGETISSFQDLIDAVRISDGGLMLLNISRPLMRTDAQTEEQLEFLSLSLTPNIIGEREDGSKIYRVGVSAPPTQYERAGLLNAISAGAVETYQITALTLAALWETITGARGTDDLGGPIKIVQLSNDVAQFGIGAFISFAAMLSINLGLINLFPIPVLDGGHLLFLAIEKIRGGKAVSGLWHEWAMRIGLGLILSLMVFVTIKDIIGLF